jgi:phage N-6-adenine-methyltransferase
VKLPQSDYFETTPEVFAELNAEFNFDLDACANADNALCAKYIPESADALTVDWNYIGDRIFCNPPYSKEGRKDDFIRKAHEAMCKGSLVVMILPAKVNTVAYHTYIWDRTKHRPYPNVQVRFPLGRYAFNMNKKKTKGGRNECMVVVFGIDDHAMVR